LAASNGKYNLIPSSLLKWIQFFAAWQRRAPPIVTAPREEFAKLTSGTTEPSLPDMPQLPQPENADGAAAAAIRSARSIIDLNSALRDAAEHFPQQAWPLQEAMTWTVTRRHWGEAAELAAKCRDAFADEKDGYIVGARALRALGRHGEADALGARAVLRFAEAWPLAELAVAAQARKAWADAAIYSAQLRDRFPADPAGFMVGLHALRQLQRLAEAETLLTQANASWPDVEFVHSEGSWLAHQRGDWNEALRRARTAQALFPLSPAGYRIATFCLVQTRHFGEAERLLETAMEKLGSRNWIMAEHARLARLQAHWPEAKRRWAEYRLAAPDQAEGFVEGAIAHRAVAEFDAAEELLREAMERFPDAPAAFEQFARVAQSRPDWVEADRRWLQAHTAFPANPHIALCHAELPARGIFDGKKNWQEAFRRFDVLRQQFPNLPEGYSTLISLLCEAKRFDAAQEVAAEAALRFPDNLVITQARAQIAEELGSVEEAVERYEWICATFPNSFAGINKFAALLAKLGRAGEADAACERAMARFPNQPEVFRQYAEVAMSRHDWAAAHARWLDAEHRFPFDRVTRKRLHQARLAMAESAEDFDAVSASVTDAAPGAEGPRAAPLTELITRFESLGGSGQGCEFGLVQRALGAEPLGLLRWSQMTFPGLIDALNSDFEGVGTPEQTVLDIYTATNPNQTVRDDPEYVTTDRRFLMRAHTFVRQSQIPFDKMYAQSCRRISFLKRKLIEELTGASKIFVFKLYERTLSDEEVRAIHGALHRYGNNTLLYVRYETDAHPSGSVERMQDGLMIGYINQFSVTKTGHARTPNLPAWTSICQEAWRLHLEEAAGRDVSASEAA